MERFNWQKGMGAALAALVSGLIAFLVLFGNPLSQRIIYSGEFGQSQKLLDMWRTVEPLPVLTPFMKDLFQVSPRKLAVVGLLFLWTLGLVRLYVFVGPRLPESIRIRSVIFGAIVWLSFFFFETFAPFNLLGEPFFIVLYELVLEAVIAVVVGWTVARAYGPLHASFDNEA